MSILDFVVQLSLGITLTSWVLRRDMARLPRDRLHRAWNAASFWSAVVAFGPLCLPVHFVRTRRTLLGFLAGCAWAGAVLAVTGLIGEGLDQLAALAER